MKATNEPNAPADPAAEPVTVPPSPLYTPEQIEELKTRAASAQENWDRLLRTTADFDNFKKRAARERTEAAQNASQALLLKLLPILDGFDMAQTAAQSAQGDKLATPVCSAAGVEEVEAAGKPFDPDVHEAVSQQETTEVPEGRVLQQLRKGYKLRDRLLRPATVIVAKHPETKA